MRARFWVWLAGGEVRLSLVDGQSIEVYQGGWTEEGYSYTTERFERDGDMIYRQSHTDACDCDGRLSWSSKAECRLDELDAHVVVEDNGKEWRWPAWQVVGRRQRDYAAEAMGY